MQEGNTQSKISKECGKEKRKLSAHLKFLFGLLLHLLLRCVLAPQQHIHHHWGLGPLSCAFQWKTTCLHAAHLAYKVPRKGMVNTAIEMLHFHEDTFIYVQCINEKVGFYSHETLYIYIHIHTYVYIYIYTSIHAHACIYI